MKTEISSLELHYLMKELQALMSAKLEQIYQTRNEELLLQLHVPNEGKRLLRIMLGKMMYLASSKGEVPEKPPGFCLYLRKKLKNARLRQLVQMGFERIVEFVFETKDAKFRLVIELFSKGNIILCNEDGIILSAMERQEWKDRSIKPKERYRYPEREFNFLVLGRDDLVRLLNNSGKENLVKTLAIDMGLGGLYAEETCLLAGIDKNLKSNQLSDKEIASVFDSISVLRDKEISPLIIYMDADKKEVRDVVPFALQQYNDSVFSVSESFNQALDQVLTKKVETKVIDATEKAAKTMIDKVNEVISQQRMRIEGLEISEKENQKRGELIYENYPLVQQVLEEISGLKKKLSWQEIRERFKGHKVIRDINIKTGEITLEI